MRARVRGQKRVLRKEELLCSGSEEVDASPEPVPYEPPFFHDDGLFFLIICPNGKVGVWLNGWGRDNDILLFKIERQIGSATLVENRGDDFGSFDPDEETEFSNTLAAWDRPLTSTEIHLLILWCEGV